MPALSNRDIVAAIRSGDLVVSPILSSGQLNASAIDLRMGNLILLPRARGISHTDPGEPERLSKQKQTPAMQPTAPAQNTKQEDETPLKRDPAANFLAERQRQQKHERHEIPFNCRFLLHPGSLILVPTLEWFRLPLDLQGVVSARSSWAREGLSIATATFINPGYEGIITLELANLGSIPIAIYPGLRLAQIAFYRTESKATKIPGQFSLSFEPKEGDIAKDDGPFARAIDSV
jgi:dCTP deaminase